MPDSEDASLILIVREAEVLVAEDSGDPVLPSRAQLAHWIGSSRARIPLGPFGSGNAYAIADPGTADLPPGCASLRRDPSSPRSIPHG